MAYWEFELYVKDMTEMVEEERQRQQEEENNYKNSPEYKRASSYKTPSMNSMNNFKPSYPKMSTPKL